LDVAAFDAGAVLVTTAALLALFDIELFAAGPPQAAIAMSTETMTTTSFRSRIR
jgi:hypothetical protein